MGSSKANCWILKVSQAYAEEPQSDCGFIDAHLGSYLNIIVSSSVLKVKACEFAREVY